MLASAYAYGVHLQDGVGCGRDEAAALRFFAAAAVGHSAGTEGALNRVQYVCPHCHAWNRNRRTTGQPKGDTRCCKCQEERVLPRNVSRRAETAGTGASGSRAQTGRAGASRPQTAGTGTAASGDGCATVMRVGSSGSAGGKGGDAPAAAEAAAGGELEPEAEEEPSIWDVGGPARALRSPCARPAAA